MQRVRSFSVEAEVAKADVLRALAVTSVGGCDTVVFLKVLPPQLQTRRAIHRPGSVSTRWLAVSIAVLGIVFTPPVQGQTKPDPPITEAAKVRALTPEEAAQERPVKLRGVVTFFDEIRRFAFLQDDSAGVFFFPGAQALPGPLTFSAGDLLEIEGVTLAGGFAPTVEGRGERGTPVKATMLGRAPLPEPAPLLWNRFNDDSFHNRYVEMRGVIRALTVDPESANLRVEFSTRGGVVRAFVPGFSSPVPRLPEEWIDVEARLLGVFSIVGNAQRQRSGLQLYVQTLHQITPDFGAVAKAFAEAPRGLETLLRFEGDRSPEKRLHVEGVMTHRVPGQGIYLRSADRGLWVASTQRFGAVPGDRVGAIGFPVAADGRAMLQDAILRKGERGAAPDPVALTVAQARSGAHHGDLVQLHGELFEETAGPGGPVLVIAAERQYFRVEMPVGTRKAGFGRVNSWVRVSGICLNGPLRTGAPAEAATDFRILVRSPADVALLREAPWWTPQRIAALIGALLAVTAAMAAWGLMLRRRVAQQTAIIQQKLEREVIWEERNRIARELHDTLEQHLAAITIQLEAISVPAGEIPAGTRDSLGVVRAMIQHSRGEAHRSVWDLRSHALEQGGLVVALREAAAALVGDFPPTIEVQTRGDERRLDRQVEFHLLRAGQEAMTNAVKHAGATRIEVEVDYGAEAILLGVRDDGRGFDPHSAPGSNAAHFGLLGMRERATKMNGELRVTSAPGDGTAISLRVPLFAPPPP